MTETMVTNMKGFPPLLRRSQALELAAGYGVSDYVFRALVPKGSKVRSRITKQRDHYRRDELVKLLEEHVSEGRC